MKLSENFALAEFTKTRHAADNTPVKSHIDNMIDLCTKVLEPLRAHFNRPITITSGYRSAAVNKAVGGSPTSYHSRGMAADIVISEISSRQIAEYIRDNLPYCELILEAVSEQSPDGVWVHVAYDKLSNSRKVLTMKRDDKGRARYFHGLQTLSDLNG
jgi:zinc D-Ala-D-Ala carboxypeptidase